MPGPEVAILGTGAWGTANAMVLAEKGVSVRLWGRRREHVEEMERERAIPHLLPGVKIHEAIRITADPEEALGGATAVAVGVPTQHIRATLGPLAAHFPDGVPTISLAKGIEIDTLLRPTEIIAAVVPKARAASLSGPSHAEEVARGVPTSVVVGAGDEALAAEVQEVWNGPRFRVYRNTDLVGVEMGGAIKNIVAVAAGVCDGLGFGDNSKAALLTRGLAELVRFGVACGGRRETFYGLSGMGDLVVTGVSQHSRNWALGNEIGGGRTLEEVLRNTEKVAEGVWTTKAVHALAARLDVPMPITAEVHAILFGEKDPKNAVRDLMTRDLRSEEEPLE